MPRELEEMSTAASVFASKTSQHLVLKACRASLQGPRVCFSAEGLKVPIGFIRVFRVSTGIGFLASVGFVRFNLFRVYG